MTCHYDDRDDDGSGDDDHIFCHIIRCLSLQTVTCHPYLFDGVVSPGHSCSFLRQCSFVVRNLDYGRRRKNSNQCRSIQMHETIRKSSSSSNAMGQERKEVYNFGFDRVSLGFLWCLILSLFAIRSTVFEPEATLAEVFEEISQLAQSCTDGYNVCIFAYGQTGSGNSFTTEGGSICIFFFIKHVYCGRLSLRQV